jgi:hypothetical protein
MPKDHRIELGEFGSTHTIRCPLCGYDNTHFEAAPVLEERSSGDAVVITMYGECNPHFALHIEEWKGIVTIFCRADAQRQE